MESGYVKNLNQSNHQWMIENDMLSYVGIMGNLLSKIEHIDFDSILEFNPGRVGLFSGLIGDEIVSGKIKNYRLMDEHYDCVAGAPKFNQTARDSRPDVSFVTHIGNVWEYEYVIPVPARYRADVVVVHYLSNTPQKFLELAVNQICRTANSDILIVDYDVTDCPINIEEIFKEEIPGCVCHTSVDNSQYNPPSQYCIYHIVKPVSQ